MTWRFLLMRFGLSTRNDDMKNLILPHTRCLSLWLLAVILAAISILHPLADRVADGLMFISILSKNIICYAATLFAYLE